MTDYRQLIRTSLRAANHSFKSGLYFHYPFCQSKCPYCHFFSLTFQPELHRLWLEGIQREVEAAASCLSDWLIVDTFYFGGGTPSYLQPEDILLLRSVVMESFQVELSEITLEINPGHNRDKVRGWLEAGVTRFSLGIQSFDPEILVRLGRRYCPEETYQLVEDIRSAGGKNINIDLIIAVPGESDSTFKANMKNLGKINPEHVSVYLLEEIEQVPFKAIWDSNPVSEDQAARTYEKYRLCLEESGWEQYEISNFSRPGFRCQHNLKYWNYEPFLGLGPSASSHLSHFRWGNPAHFESWLAATKSRSPVFSEFLILRPEDEINERLAAGLRLKDGLDWEQLKQSYPDFDFSCYEQRIERLTDEGLLVWRNSNLIIPASRILVSNSIIAELIE